MKRVKFTNGTQKFWVKDTKKIKWWRGLTGLAMSSVRELKEEE